jgi:hypothetical protein
LNETSLVEGWLVKKLNGFEGTSLAKNIMQEGPESFTVTRFTKAKLVFSDVQQN